MQARVCRADGGGGDDVLLSAQLGWQAPSQWNMEHPQRVLTAASLLSAWGQPLGLLPTMLLG